MPQLLLELFQEEIPARMQAQAAADLLRLLTKSLTDRGLTPENAQTHVTPRRLAFTADLPAASAGIEEELKGPRTSAPSAALDGFLKKTGLTKDALTIQADPKGDFYLARISKPGRAAPDIIAEAAVETIRAFPWPKSMRWESSRLQWVRPLRHILCLFDGRIVPFEIAGLTASNVTRGHRQMANEPFEVQDFGDYRAKLRERRVILDRAERKEEIHRQALAAAAKAGLTFREDEELLEEVAGLVEWPVVLTGKFDEAFLEIPNEVLVTTMRKNQKYFALTESASFEAGPSGPAPQDDGSREAEPTPLRHGKVRPRTRSGGASKHAPNEAPRLSNTFLIVSNLDASDGGAAIVAGNEKVIRPRLADAKFFWDLDRKTTLESRLDELRKITFHAKLGTQWDRVQRIERLAGEIAERIGADVEQAKLAARLCKADLVTGTVGEFPEVQGTIGGYLAGAEGLGDAVATAIADHYRPQGPADLVPTDTVAIAVALADKLDTLVGFFAIDEKPTGSKDPYALRRAALGVVRIVLESNLRVDLIELAGRDLSVRSGGTPPSIKVQLAASQPNPTKELRLEVVFDNHSVDALDALRSRIAGMTAYVSTQFALKEFFAERLTVQLRSGGARHDVVASVLSFATRTSDNDRESAAAGFGFGLDLVLLVRRVEALQSFLATDDGKTLLAGYKRAANILRIEEKKDKATYGALVDPAKLEAPEEKALSDAIDTAAPEIERALAAEDFAAAMRALSGLRAPVDAFFEKVTVNAPDAALRTNRLNLLARIKQAAHLVADFSKIEG